MFRRLILLGVAIGLAAPVGFAQSPPIIQPSLNRCAAEIDREIAKEYELLKIMLFGQSAAADAPVGVEHMAKDGVIWRKKTAAEWHTTAAGFESTTWYNAQVDDQSVLNEAMGQTSWRGILARKHVLTSELIPEIGQGLHAIDCRLEEICSMASQSRLHTETDAQTITVQEPGCRSVERNTFPGCHNTDEGTQNLTVATTIRRCQTVVDANREHIGNMVHSAVVLDAATRSIYQVAGNFDLLFDEIQQPLLTTLRQVSNLVGSLGRVPCFASSCDASPPDLP